MRFAGSTKATTKALDNLGHQDRSGFQRAYYVMMLVVSLRDTEHHRDAPASKVRQSKVRPKVSTTTQAQHSFMPATQHTALSHVRPTALATTDGAWLLMPKMHALA